ncbi:MAG: ribosome hibernation promoting factor [Gammaproteobacteria bacterium]|nr:ribosome hibernation promoting factor [Gammaproteobacteria bacterium]
MQINLSGHHIDITDSLRDYVNSKMERLERHFDNVTDVHVVLTVEKNRHNAEATVHLTGSKLFADAEQEDMYAAIDGLIDKLDRQVKKHKEKLKDHHRSEAVSMKTQEIETEIETEIE